MQAFRLLRFFSDLKLIFSFVLALVGKTGSGKTSLLRAILGELEAKKGCVLTQGAIAYVAQESCLVNATLRENILFGSPYNEEWYVQPTSTRTPAHEANATGFPGTVVPIHVSTHPGLPSSGPLASLSCCYSHGLTPLSPPPFLVFIV